MALKYVGVNLSGLEFGSGIGAQGSTYVLPGENNYAYWAQNAGSNIIRLPFTWERLQPQANGSLDQTYLSYLKSSVAYAQAHGQTIILDMHNYGLYNGQTATAAQLSDVWTKLGTVFSGNSSVWYDLMNEPNGIPAQQWENTTQQVVNNMRAAGIDNQLLLEGTAWSGAWTWVTSGNAAAYNNFTDPLNKYAFDVHQYLDSDGSGTSATAVSGSGSSRLVAITNWAESTGHKLFLGETGLANNAGSEIEMKAMITYMNAHTDAWLGMTLWGAGPWWPQNYIFNVNPTGLGTSNVTNASDITDMLSFLTPASSQTTNSPPVAQPDNFSGQENTAISGNVLANNGHGADTDPNGLALSVAAATLTTAHGGSVVLNADGSFTYQPASNFSGTDSFTYTLQDTAGLSATGTVTLAVNAPANLSLPVAQADNFTGQQYHTVTGNVLANNGNGADTDPNGLALSVTAANLTTAHGGTIVLNADGTFTYNPASSFYGADSFTYTLKDSAGLSSTGTVNISVNAAPVAHPDDLSGQENVAISGNVLANNGHGADSDPVAATLSVTAAALTTAHGGTVALNADGTFTYNPAAGFNGTDSFNYTLLDGRGGQATGAVTLAVNAPTNLPLPVAQADNFTGQQYHIVTGNVLANNGNGADTDPNGLALSVTAANLTTAHGGTVVLNADGTFTYNPASSFYGADSFTYTLKDSAGLTVTGTVNISVNAAPVAHPDDLSGAANVAISGNVLANNGHGADSDPVAATLSVTAAALTTVHGGHVSLQADGSFTYTSASGYSGADSFNYTLLDGRGGQAIGTATLAIVSSGMTVNGHVLILTGSGWDLNSSNYPAVNGIDTVDVRGVTNPQLVISPAMVSASDTGNLTILFGTGGIASLDTSQQASASNVILKGQGTVTLANGVYNNLSLDSSDNITVHTGTVGDHINITGGTVTVDGGGGGDWFSVSGAGVYTLIGGGGDNSFDFSSTAYLKGNTVAGSTGNDQLRLYDNANLTSSDLSHISGIDMLTLYGGTNVLAGIGGIFGSQLQINGANTSEHLSVNIGNMSSSQTLTLSGSLLTTLTDSVGHTYNIHTTSSFTGEIHGGAGSEVMTGGSGANKFYAGSGNDILIGGTGNDLLAAGTGTATMTGGSGTDTFTFTSLSGHTNVITDFNATYDKLDLSHLIEVANPLQKGINNFIHVTTQGTNTVLSVDPNGAANGSHFTSIVVLDNVHTNVATLIASGHLIV